MCFLGLDEPRIAPTLRDAAEQAMGSKLTSESLSVEKRRGRVRGLFCGGTLCAEAELIFRRQGLRGHEFIDLGADEYTRGRPHPMIEPEIRNDHVKRALADPAVAVILLDVVLGYGAHPDPASVLLMNDVSGKVVIASVTGTETALPAAQELQQKFGSKLILVRAVEPESQRMVATVRRRWSDR